MIPIQRRHTTNEKQKELAIASPRRIDPQKNKNPAQYEQGKETPGPSSYPSFSASPSASLSGARQYLLHHFSLATGKRSWRRLRFLLVLVVVVVLFAVLSSTTSLHNKPTSFSLATSSFTTTAAYYTISSLDSFAVQHEPRACHQWFERCHEAAQHVAKQGTKENFPREFCTTKFACPNRQPAWKTASIAYQPILTSSSRTIRTKKNNKNNKNNTTNNKKNNTTKTTSQYLVIHLPGTGATPHDHTLYTSTIANLGYYVLSLAYASYPMAVSQADAYCSSLRSRSRRNGRSGSVSPDDDDDDDETAWALASAECHRQLHEAVVFGATLDNTTTTPPPPSPTIWPVPYDESIEALATHALHALGWTQFLTTTTTTVSVLDWSTVLVSGHSQGASHAAYIATHQPVVAALLLSGPQERVPAGWGRRPSSAQHPTIRRALFSVYEECGDAPQDDEAAKTTTRAYCRPTTATTVRAPELYNITTTEQQQRQRRHGTLVRNSLSMNMTYQDITTTDRDDHSTTTRIHNNNNSRFASSSSKSYFIQHAYEPRTTTNTTTAAASSRRYHNMNVHNEYAPSQVQHLWRRLFQDLV